MPSSHAPARQIEILRRGFLRLLEKSMHHAKPPRILS
jgi:hypothetical protein